MENKIIKTNNNASLVDALDKVVKKGAYVSGDLMLQVAEIDLLYVGLRIIIASSSKVLRNKPKYKETKEDKIFIKAMEEKIKKMEEAIPKIVQVENKEDVEKGLGKLVLTLVDLIKQLLEREAIRKIDSGKLSDIETQKLGLTFKALDQKIEQLKKLFGIEEELDLDLGPLGQLL